MIRGVAIAALRHRGWAYSVAALLPAVLAAWCVYDREPPFHLYAIPGHEIPVGHAGQEITFDFPAERDLGRNCSLSFQRYMIDSSKASKLYGNDNDISADGIKHREVLSPSRLRIKVTIPPTMPSGRSHLITEAAYTCPRNLSTYVWPIRLTFDWEFEVLPPVANNAALGASR